MYIFVKQNKTIKNKDMKTLTQNLKDTFTSLMNQAGDIYRDDLNSLRFCLGDGDYTSQSNALKTLGIKTKDLNNQFISRWCYDDGFLHITFTNDTLALLGMNTTDFDFTCLNWLNDKK